MQNKILVIRGGAIGDFILTLPVLAALREHFPQSRIAIMGYPHIVQIALLGGLADEVRSIESLSLAPFFAPGGKLPPQMVSYFSEAAVIISYLYDPDEVFKENVLRCFNGTFIAGPHRPSESLKIHATDTFLKPLERLAIFAPDPVPQIKIKNEPSETTDEFWLAVHPGSGSEAKNWPLNKWLVLLDELNKIEKLKILMIAGEAEEDKLEKLTSTVSREKLELARNLPLKDLALRMSKCNAYIGHDSGITHLAAAVGLSGVVLWGGSALEVWRPRSEKFKVVKSAGGIFAIPVEEVLSELKSIISA
ncbi:MAG: glycosyltransferase family 9 protein [Limisphaerales bacterium]|jgi:heptosyltransferase-2